VYRNEYHEYYKLIYSPHSVARILNSDLSNLIVGSQKFWPLLKQDQMSKIKSDLFNYLVLILY